MAVLNPANGLRMADKIAKALGITTPCQRIVIEMDVRDCVRVYFKGIVRESEIDAVADLFKVIPVDDVTVADDTTVHFVEAVR